jgi:hypothetical protein
MRFIESFLGLSPDNNSGATETAIFLALFVAMIAFWYLSRRHRSVASKKRVN